MPNSKTFKIALLAVAMLTFTPTGSQAQTLEQLRKSMPSDTLLVLTRSQVDKKDYQIKVCQDANARLQIENELYKKLNVKGKAIEANYAALDQEAQQKLTAFRLREGAYTDSLRLARRHSLRLGKLLKVALPTGIVAGFWLGTKF